MNRCPACKNTEYLILEYTEELSDKVHFKCTSCYAIWSHGYIGTPYVDSATNVADFRNIYRKYSNGTHRVPNQLEIRKG